MRFAMWAVTAMAALAGCAAVPLDRDKLAKISSIDTVRVEAPPIQVMTVMQAYAKSPSGGGLIPGLIADAEGRALVAKLDAMGFAMPGLRGATRQAAE